MRRAMAVAAACAALGAAADDDARWYLQHDNDVVFGTDRWYSSGSRLARVQRRGGYELEVGLLQEIYVPEAKRFGFGIVDRAPTARLFLDVARHDRSPTLTRTLELGLGVRGPGAMGRQTTDAVHRIVPAHDVDWSRQESNRFDAFVAGVHTHHLGRVDAHYGVVAGNELAFAHAGAALHWGLRDLSSPLLRMAATPPWGGDGERGWGAFLGANVRAVARNEMLHRGYGAFTGDVERRNAVARGVAGVAYKGSLLAFTFALALESREFETQRTPQRFGSVTLHAGF